MTPERPGFPRHVFLLWELRATLALNQRRRRASAVVAYVLSCLPAVALFLGARALLRSPAIARSPEWSLFCLNMLCFVCFSVFVAWPLLSAGVDDHSELSRYAAYPISGVRLLFASSLASLFEPRSIVILSPLAGAALGYASARPPASWAVAGTLFVLYLFLCAGWSRAGVHLVLNVLRQKRSAELIGGSFVVLLIACSFIPPVDASWLLDLGGGLGVLSMEVVVNAARALGRVPPGFLGSGLALLGRGRVGGALLRAGALGAFAVVGYAIAYRLLLQFHRQSFRGGRGNRRGNPFAGTRRLSRTLFAREALDLWHNPRARLLASVPFLLAILLRLLSGRDLVIFLAGKTADAWIVGALCLYGAVVLASTFSQNAFGYDGQGLAALLAAPIDPRALLVAKNELHGLAGAALALAVSLFVAVYFRTLHFVDWACAMAGVAALLPVLLAAGNFLSLLFPVRFHANLERRDRLPFAASMLGVAAAAIGSLPFTLALRAAGRRGPTLATFAAIAGCAVVAWIVYRALLPPALALLDRRRELVLQAVTRA
ncbi:MAG TPA: hypothetical protein VMB50_21385 [Myxococcales bacterium]|nr:hypothetical protein [Myxococcales bacterium]